MTTTTMRVVVVVVVVVVVANLEDFVLYAQSIERADGCVSRFWRLILDKSVAKTLSCHSTHIN